MDKLVIITNGSGGCGKDTVAKMIKKLTGWKVYKYSSITKVKEICKMCGWEGTKTDKDRQLMCDIKRLAVDFCDMPIKDMTRIYDKFMMNILPPSDDDKYSGFDSNFPVADVLIFDIREPDEIHKAVLAFNAKTLLILRENSVTCTTSDANVQNYRYDYVIDNSGSLEDLENEVKSYIRYIMSK